jgi:HPt (histidine-containing phosphotransfer) domain-containing protein
MVQRATVPIQSSFANIAGMAKVVAHFVQELPRRVGQMNKLIETNNRDDLLVAVHRLKGAGGGFGFAAISELAAAAEARLKSDPPVENLAAAVEELISLIRRVEGYDPAIEATSCEPISNLSAA